MVPKILLIGLGGLGSALLNQLSVERGLGEIVVASRDEGRGMAICNVARLGAMAQSRNPSIRFVVMDLEDEARVAEIVDREAPDLILHTATKQAWWLPYLLPPPYKEKILSAGFGVWLPVHLTLTLRLMRALGDARYVGFTLSAPFPDVIHPILARLKCAPTCGIGNLGEIVPKIRLLAAQRLGVKPDEVHVLMVAHHALESVVFRDPNEPPPSSLPPYYLRIEHRGQVVTEKLDGEECLLSPHPLPAGPGTHFLTVGSTIRLIRALFRGPGGLVHVPGPNGLPGGYPMVASPKGLRHVMIPDLSLAQAIVINERSHPFDGIERVAEDGTVEFSPHGVDILDDLLGYRCERLSPDQAAARADELIDRFQSFAARHGVKM